MPHASSSTTRRPRYVRRKIVSCRGARRCSCNIAQRPLPIRFAPCCATLRPSKDCCLPGEDKICCVPQTIATPARCNTRHTPPHSAATQRAKGCRVTAHTHQHEQGLCFSGFDFWVKAWHPLDEHQQATHKESSPFLASQRTNTIFHGNTKCSNWGQGLSLLHAPGLRWRRPTHKQGRAPALTHMQGQKKTPTHIVAVEMNAR